MTLEQLTSQYGESYVLSSGARRVVISERLIDACQDLLSRDLKSDDGKTFKFTGEHNFEEFKEKMLSHFGSKDAEMSAAELNFIFSGREKTIEQLTYDVIPDQFENIVIEKVIAGYKGNRTLYEMLLGLSNPDPSKRPISNSGSDSQVTFNFERLEKRCKTYVEDFKVYVYGKKITGEEYEEDILVHGNQVMATETSPEGITYTVEKSGDLPSDENAREEMLAERIQELDEMVGSGEVARYEIEEFSNKTIIKTYFKVFEDYEAKFNVDTIL